MTETIIHLDGELPIQILNERGWIQGQWEDGTGHVCAHQAIRLCAPVPGDAFIIEQVAERLWGKGVGWNDNTHTRESEVREWLGGGIDVTDEDLAEVFGINWRAVIDVVRKSATLTPDQVKELSAAWDAARDAAWDAAWGAARDAARDAARGAQDLLALNLDSYKEKCPQGSFINLIPIWELGLYPIGVVDGKFIIYIPPMSFNFPEIK